jgi:xanthine dehydrogenase YagS FAD-binding subunit
MQSFHLAQPGDVNAAIGAAASGGVYIAGGTDLLQLMKDNVVAPTALVDIEPLPMAQIEAKPEGLRLGALARMSDVAAHPVVARDYPMISAALLASASPQIRNMGTMGGNLLQRTRCNYFRDTGFACNKRAPGSGCAALHGSNRMLAILGTSEHCIASHPSDLAVTLVALDAELEIQGPNGTARRMRVAELHRLPGDRPEIEANLAPGEIIVAVNVPASAAARNSRYLKVRDRASFEFALVSAAVAMEVQGGMVRDIRVAAGGVGAKPWRLPEVESALQGRPANAESFRAAAALAGIGAKPASENGFKVELLKRTVLRTLSSVPV